MERPGGSTSLQALTEIELYAEEVVPSPAFDPAEPDPVPEFDFDQSLPDDLDP